MANITVSCASAHDGLIRWEIIYDDITLAISRIQVVNNSDQSALVGIRRTGTPFVREQVVLAQSSAGRDLPPNVSFSQNVDGNLTMGNLILYGRNPA